MKEIPLTQGKVALVDDEDYERVNAHKWFAHKSSCGVDLWYAHRNVTIGKKKQTTVTMHRFIMAPPDGVLIDHHDRDGLNNTRENLRLASHAENMWNRTRNRTRKTAKYKGVVLRPACVRWSAHITHKGVSLLLGRFATQEDAARAYDRKARELFGEFALCNFPDELILEKAA